MIEQSEEDVKSRSIGDFDSDDFGIEEKNLGMAYKAFMQYSDPIGSIVREITSNAWDANKEAGNDEPVVIEMSQKYPPDDERWIAFRDSGTGLVPLPRHTPDGRKAKSMFEEGEMSEEKMKEVWDIIREKILDANVPSMLIYKMFFSSTKRKAINQLGYFGLGAKSPLGYADMFEVITRYSGWKYHYVVRKGEEKPQLDLLGYEETDRENGTTVRVPVASSSDWTQFRESIDTQLAYFDNVVFEGGIDDVDNNFTIYRGEHFIYRPDAEFDAMHICLGKVYYPLDFDVMDIYEGYTSYSGDRSGHQIPVGLYFSLEDQKDLPIKVVWNRENIEYNDKTKESINKKLKLAKEELRQLFHEQFEDIRNVEDWYGSLDIANRDLIRLDDDVEIPITDEVIDQESRKPEIPRYNAFLDKTPGDPFYMLEMHRRVDDGYIDQDGDNIKMSNAFYNPENYDPLFITEDKFSTKKNKWINSHEISGRKFIILRVKDLPTDIDDPDEREMVANRYKAYFSNNNDADPDDINLRAMLRFEERARDVFFKRFRDYDSVTVSDSFSPSKKKKKNKWANYDRDKKFPLKEASLQDGYNDEHSWSRARWKYDYLETLNNDGTMVIYGHNKDDERLKRLMELFDNIRDYKDTRAYGNKLDHQKIRLVKIAKSRADMFSELRGSFHVDDFWESDHRIFRRMVNAFFIRDSLPDRTTIKKWKSYIPEANEIYQELSNLKNQYSFNHTHKKWVDKLLSEKAHLIDPDVVKKMETIQGYIFKYPLLTWLERGTPNLNGLASETNLREELREYISDQSSIDPHLLYRYKRHKNQQENGS